MRYKENAKRPEYKRKKKDIHFRARYGLTLDEHKQIYIDQQGCCAICGIPTAYDKIVTDHNHKTDIVRGLLCHHCNIWVAAIDDEVFMKTAIEYVKRGV